MYKSQGKSTHLALIVGSLILLCFSSALLAAEPSSYPVAGVEPSQRPDTAPISTETEKDKRWYQQALQGVEGPYPQSLRFLEDQGGWYTPFNRAGMTGPYDLRDWHKQ